MWRNLKEAVTLKAIQCKFNQHMPRFMYIEYETVQVDLHIPLHVIRLTVKSKMYTKNNRASDLSMKILVHENDLLAKRGFGKQLSSTASFALYAIYSAIHHCICLASEELVERKRSEGTSELAYGGTLLVPLSCDHLFFCRISSPSLSR